MKAIGKVIKVLFDLLLAAMVISALAIVIPNLFGIKTLAVLSGSMEPNLPVGSMVYAVPTQPEQIIPGDPISFVMNEQGLVVTHRVIEADRQERYFIVQGDANNAPDPKPVLYENVIGVVRFHIPAVGYVLGLTLDTRGKIIIGTVIVSMILITLLVSVDDPKKGKAAAEKPKGSERGTPDPGDRDSDKNL